MAEGPNRTVVGLPDRLIKAKERIGILENRQELIRQVIHDPTANTDQKLATINGIALGKYDHPQ